MNPESLHDYLLVTAFLTNLAVNLITVAKLFRNAPQKREIHLAETYASKEEVTLLRNDLTSLREQVREDKNEILCAGEERLRKLHDRIDAIIDQIPWRIVALLKTKGPRP